VKVDVQVRGLEELKRELARLSGAVQTRLSRNACMAGARLAAKEARGGRATALSHSETPGILELRRRIAYTLVYALAVGATIGADVALSPV
jgi:hypothetical protein